MIRRAIACVLTLGCAAVLNAQPRATIGRTTDTIDITLENDCNVSEVWVVRDGLDRKRLKAQQDSANPCHWTATLPGGDTYHTNINRFSLRLAGRARSRCMKASARARTRAGHLVYACCSGGYAYDVSVSGGNAVRYAREIDDCMESGEVSGSGPEIDRTIYDVQFGIEDLRLEVTENKPAPCALIVDRLPSLRRLPKDKTVTIKREETAAALKEQDVRAKNCYPPVISVPNIEIRERLELKPLEITVK